MLKKFFISMLGTIAGLWVTVLIGAVVLVSILSSIVASDATTSIIKDKSILYLNLDGSMSERVQPGDIWQVIQEGESDAAALIDIIDAVHAASEDSRIKGIYINAGNWSAGYASCEEIVAALREFRKSGKWIYAYGDSYLQGAYALSAQADSVFLNPMGSVSVHGVASQTPFFTGLLEKLGVKMQIIRVGTYKSAVEPFFAKEMSEASRLQTKQMCDSLWTWTSDVIAGGRNVGTQSVMNWADSMMTFWEAPRVEESQAVNALRYRRNVEDMMRGKLGLKADDELPLVTPSDFLATQRSLSKDKDHVAVLFAVGDIVNTGDGGIVGDKMTPEIITLADDDHVKGLVLRINSGGGSAFASEQIWEALEYFKSKGKPFYVSMGDVAASGGYYIACGADSIFADRTTITGSIGVFGMIPDLSGLVTGHLGVTFSTVESNPNAMLVSGVEPLSPAQRDGLQAGVDQIYETFTARVAQGRGMSQDSVKSIAEGRVWIGGRALELGLVDCIGDLRSAIAVATSRAGVEARDIVYYPEVDDNILVEVLRQARGSVQVGNITVDAATRRMMQLVDWLSNAPVMQARMQPLEFR